MTTRRVVALASASALLAIGALAALLFVSVTQTSWGRDRTRQIIQGLITESIGDRGSVYVGNIRGGYVTGVTIDSLAIRDEEDSLFISTGPVRVEYDPRDLLDKRVLIRSLEVDRPLINLRRRADGKWNYEHIFPRDRDRQRQRRRERGWGDYIVAREATIRDGTFLLTLLWSPPDSLRGARRDSAIAFALADTTREVRPTSEGYKRTHRWTDLQASLSAVRIANPDSVGRFARVDRIDVIEHDPPFRFSALAGTVDNLGDTVWLNLDRFELPGSSGRATGTVIWGSGLPIRYDLKVQADTFAMADVAWVYPTLPTDGGGKGRLHLRNDPRNLDVIDYALHDMDVRSSKSHLRGDMTFAVGGPVLVIKDVNLVADPLDFDFVRTMNGAPFPVDWQGQLFGTLRGRGGPVNRFVVDEARVAFHDKHVPGAISRATARGVLDVLDPAETRFRGFEIQVENLDLRTPRYVFDEFPALDGTVFGRATLDSSWLDVRFRETDLTHVDGPGAPSRITGAGRLTLGDEFVTWDAELFAPAISFNTLARSYPGVTLRGVYTGPVRVRGTLESLQLTSTITGPAGVLGVDGTFDFLEPSFQARGLVRAEGLDVRTLFERPELPRTRLTGTASLDVGGESLATIAGRADVELERSLVDSLRILPSTARLSFGGGRMAVESLRLASTVGTLTATGALGLSANVSDSLHYAVRVDSLGGLRPWFRTDPVPVRERMLASLEPALDGSLFEEDFTGTAQVQGVLVGTLDTLGTLNTTGRLEAQQLRVGTTTADSIVGTFAVDSLTGAFTGATRFLAVDASVAGVALTRAELALDVASPEAGSVDLAVDGRGGVRAGATVGYRIDGGATRLAIDSLLVQFPDHEWRLRQPTTLVVDSAGFVLDTLVLANGGRSRLMMHGSFPVGAPVSAGLVVDSMPLSDIGAMLDLRDPLRGALTLDVDVRGYRADPALRFSASADGLRIGTYGIPRAVASGNYGGRRLDLDLALMRNGQSAMTATASVPLDLALEPRTDRILGDALRGRVRADRLDLSILESVTPNVQRISGTASSELVLGGTVRQPRVTGQLRVDDAATDIPNLGIRLTRVNADIRVRGDSVIIERMVAVSGPQPGDSAAITGTIVVPDASRIETATLDLALVARSFQAVRTRRLADLEVTGGTTLRGPYDRATLRGGVRVDRGVIYVPERAQRQVVDLAQLTDPDFADIVDTAVTANRALLVQPPLALVQNMQIEDVRIALGEDVWLRAEDVNIKLRPTELTLRRVGQRLVPEGTVYAERGVYRLNLGVVQRSFRVDSGAVTFFADTALAPQLDFVASYIVRNPQNRQEVRIRAHITGTLEDPRLDLSSDERIPISYTEIVSYLVFGAPSFALGERQNTLNQALSFLLPTVSSELESRLRETLNVDVFRIQAGTLGSEGDAGSRDNLLQTTSFYVGKQFGRRLFGSANAGICQAEGPGGSAGVDVAGVPIFVGVALELRLNHGFFAQFSRDPTNPCRPTLIQVNDRYQIGFDLFREWSF